MIAFLQLRAALETPETALRDGAVVLAAVEKNDEDAVAALLAQNWPADASTKEGDLALHVAADRGHVAAARALLDGGAAVDAPGGDGATPLMRATAAAQPDVVALLLNRGASVQLQTRPAGALEPWTADRNGAGAARVGSCEATPRNSGSAGRRRRRPGPSHARRGPKRAAGARRELPPRALDAAHRGVRTTRRMRRSCCSLYLVSNSTRPTPTA